ncbi:putative SDA1 family protein [Mitosporidium daphniae]|uniref:Protein SDA1 n=1 Tax=Mitosporidium daphniae TaxID=1485682 RepID=A0A098VWE6_9MICR|nr:putative SDA1 family protein [Mitosporidium daphniae]KGG53209.1 putative SDA1 family protein [Mitosporidium daphniae]|eukprot:XP_013239648.1 putative SDA1 family protein [Mitosporidium daphniae]
MLSTEGSCSRFSPTNYPQLQNLLRKDPSSYYEEFLQQERHFHMLFDLYFKDIAFYSSFNVSSSSSTLTSLVTFLAHTAGCYQGKGLHLSSFIRQLIEIIRISIERNDTPALAKTLLPSLIIARHKCMDEESKRLIVDFLFEILSKIPDLVYGYLVQEAKTSPNDKSFKRRITSTLSKKSEDPQNQQHAVLALRIGVEMFTRFKSWQETEVIRVISECALSNCVKVSLFAINFFLGGITTCPTNDSGDANHQEVLFALRHSLHTSGKSRAKLRKEKTAIKKLNENATEKEDQVPSGNVNLIALNLLPDPDDFCERLGSIINEKQGTAPRSYEHRLLIIRLQSCLISNFKLILPSFYERILRYLKPTQKDCTKILAYIANAMHESLNDMPENGDAQEEASESDTLLHLLHSVTLTISRNFVAEHCRPEVITVGLNALREIASRLPQAISKEVLVDVLTLSSDANASKAMTRNKGVKMAAKSLLSLYRTKAPEHLLARLRGRPPRSGKKLSEAEPDEFNEAIQDDFDVHISGGESDEDFEDESDLEEDEDLESLASGYDSEAESEEKLQGISECESKSEVSPDQSKTDLRSEMTSRFLSPEELQLLKENDSEDQENSEGEVSLGQIQKGANAGGKPSKEERLLVVKAGREGRTYGKKHHSSQTTKRKKTKSFMMLVHKRGGPLSKSHQKAGVGSASAPGSCKRQKRRR